MNYCNFLSEKKRKIIKNRKIKITDILLKIQVVAA